MKKKPVVLIVAAAIVVLAIAVAVMLGGNQPAQASAMAELNVSNLTCGSCVSKVQKALAAVEGVGQVEVSVTSGRSQVLYDPAKISSVEISRIVSAAGYPATVRSDLSAEEYQKMLSENEQLSATYIARIGSRLLSRADFDQALQLRAGTALDSGSTPYANPQLQAQVWQELKEREVLLAAADKNQIVVQDGEVSLEIDRMKGPTKDFDSVVTARFGSYDRFFAQVKENMIINRNIETHVVAGLTGDREKQLRFSQWYGETLKGTNVVIFDPVIKLAEASGSSSCGGSCGG